VQSIDNDSHPRPRRAPEHGTEPRAVSDHSLDPGPGRLRVGIVGAGHMAQHHARAVPRAAGLARVAAVADPLARAREALRALCPEAAGFASVTDMLASEPLDVVHVCTPPETHVRIARAALEAGCHVYVEKPFAPTVREAETLIELAAERGLSICAGHQLLFEPPARQAAALLPTLGTLCHVESYFSFRALRHPVEGRVPPSSDLQLLDVLPHPAYLLLQFLEAAEPAGRTEIVALETGPAGTVHALVRRGNITGSLVVTLEGRPIESYLRMVGTNGSLHADFVRSTVQRLIGPGTSGIDKLLNPFRLSRQLLTGTTMALGRRVLKRQMSYPGLAEIFEAFYRSVNTGSAPPVSAGNIVDTVRTCEAVADALSASSVMRAGTGAGAGERVLVTGGTGFLGRAVVQALTSAGTPVRVLARREPASWEQVAGADYAAAELAQPLDPALLEGVGTVIHCAAATAGGWDEHQASSIGATENLLRAAAAAGVRRIVHVSSIAVLAQPRRGAPIDETTPLEPDSRGSGPYVWGKLESERLAMRLAEELGLEIRIVRPGAIVDFRNFDPPGRLGRRVGNVFVAVGSPRDRLGVVDVEFTARTLVWMARHFDQAPAALNLVAPALPTKRELVELLKRNNPDLRVVWFPRLALVPASWAALGLQRALRPRQPAIDVAKVFAPEAYDTSRVAALADRIAGPASPA
jgi:predicted dehydrogenase/nucleoside-diphosphate-sugar epimerase